VKASLAAIENKRRISDEKDKNKPGLRQALVNNKNDRDDTSAPLSGVKTRIISDSSHSEEP
jgi:hypothetical protein